AIPADTTETTRYTLTTDGQMLTVLAITPTDTGPDTGPALEALDSLTTAAEPHTRGGSLWPGHRAPATGWPDGAGHNKDGRTRPTESASGADIPGHVVGHQARAQDPSA